MKKSKYKLTVIISARNEGQEVTNTIDSLFTTIGPEVEVILINDHSDSDKFPEVEARPNLTILHNKLPVYGLYDSVHSAVEIMKANKFFFCNCRCRFTEGWAEAFIKAIDNDPQTIFTPTMKSLSYENTNMDEAVSCYGAQILHKWDERPLIYYQTKAIKDKRIPAVAWLGGMGFNKEWFLKLGGLHPLMTRGGMNVFTSLKCWKAGGSVKVLDVEIGNIGRHFTSYPVTESDQLYNYIALAYILRGPAFSDEVMQGFKDKRGIALAKHAFVHRLNDLSLERQRIMKLKKRDITDLLT